MRDHVGASRERIAMRSHSLHMLIVLSVALCMAVGTLSSHTASSPRIAAVSAH
jgi:hypothetical protein